MKDKITESSPALSLALLFGWLLSFPMFGPWLARSAGVSIGVQGMSFLVGNIIGFVIAGSFNVPLCRRTRLILPGTLSSLTAINFLFALPPFAALLLLFLLGLITAQLIVEWARWFVRCSDPYIPLAISIVGANLLLILFMLPLPIYLLLPVLIGLPLVASIMLPSINASNPTPLIDPDKSSVTKSLGALAAFGIVVFFVGGVWFRVYTVPSFPSSTSLAIFDNFCYILGIVGLAWWLRGKQDLAPIAAVTLSALGLGLVFAQSTSHTLARVLMSLGLAGGDYYFWLALWVLSRYLPAHRTFGWGLGFSLLQIAIATLFDMFGLLQGYDRQTLLFVAMGVTMILLPVIFSSRFQVETNAPPDVLPLEIAANLTESESKVFALLALGKSDQEMADELYISRHTVKFHVRNILHKFDAPNRKVLLSRLNTPTGSR